MKAQLPYDKFLIIRDAIEDVKGNSYMVFDRYVYFAEFADMNLHIHHKDLYGEIELYTLAIKNRRIVTVDDDAVDPAEALYRLEAIEKEYYTFMLGIETNAVEDLLAKMDKLEHVHEMIGYLNSIISQYYTKVMDPTTGNQVKHLLKERAKLLAATIKDLKVVEGTAPERKKIETEIVSREVITTRVEKKKSKVLKIVVEKDAPAKLVNQLIAELDQAKVKVTLREEAPEGTYDIVITKNKKFIQVDEIHFEPTKASLLISTFNRIIGDNVKRAKFIQAVKPMATYKDLVGLSFFQGTDEHDRPVAIGIQNHTVWSIDMTTVKDKYKDETIIRYVKKIESKEVIKGQAPVWD